ncbi:MULTISPECIES: replication initiation protein [unclassified Escherichia]|uniref:replication initiation protein n=2 Tax=Escherichia TaxID=561 RepID=UPI001592E776|nr:MULTISPECIES: replication initiation protein [unclassified Escherichia]MBB2360799.1 replication initiation protein [Escherichia coli]MBB2346561.1 replication initiation protein [Escherichia sp. 93.0743]MBB2350678.1 replication initiation protein [Escherichia sp. 92.1228]MBB7453578.1 replication initiation protein [Escherichia coli]MBB7458314.1 replication initiation protein [Escherichia coli]
MNKKLIAYKSNALIEASYKLTLQEQRLLLMCIGRLNPQEETPTKKFQITSNDFYESFPDVGLRNAGKRLQEAINRLAERWIYITTDKERRRIRWIQEEAEYFSGEGKVEIIFADSIMPYLTQLQGQFTKIVIKNVSALKRTYSIRIYELLMQFKSIGDRIIDINDFRFMLGIDNKYQTFKSLKQLVITPAIKELNEKSNLTVTVDTVKQGRKVVALHFRFTEDKQIKMAIGN